jgi:hypothetical protein
VPINSDLIQAKQVLSARLLAVGLRGGALWRPRMLTVAAAVVSAGRNVHAVGIGPKITEGRTTSTLCIRIYVTQKIALSLLPQRDQLPQAIHGVPTDVIEAPPAFAAHTKVRKKLARRAASPGTAVVSSATAGPTCTDQRRNRQRPVVAGISTAHHDITAGTLGYFCRSTRHGDDPAQICVLSNSHIYSNLNRAVAGDPLYQPGPLDGGVAADHFADFLRTVPVQFGTTANRVDAALGSLLADVPYDVQVCTIGKITGTTRAVENMQVRKHGRTTGYAEGTVSDELIDAIVAMDPDDPSKVGLFQNQMRLVPTEPFKAIGLGGDSGSLVVDKSTSQAVGLYFANPSTGEYGYANHIADVLADLEIQLL